MSDLVVARNCYMTRMFPEKPSWCRNEQVCQGGQQMCKALCAVQRTGYCAI